jgi:hypothetical protein
LNITLAEALSRVDTYLSNNPGVEQAYRQSRSKLNPWVLLIVVIGAVFLAFGLLGKFFAS